MAKNHYIPQFIIKRFSDKVNKMNVFDKINRSILENVESKDIYYEDDLYDPKIEEMFNRQVEDPIAKLLDRKIIGFDEIQLTRTELLLLKKYMLITSVRTLGVGGFLQVIQ